MIDPFCVPGNKTKPLSSFQAIFFCFFSQTLRVNTQKVNQAPEPVNVQK